MKHFTIPVFVPELACPNRCVFCNQHSISGCQNQPEPDEVRHRILEHLRTIPIKDSRIEIGFFGGSFTGIQPELQERYLAVANEFLTSGLTGTASHPASSGQDSEISPLEKYGNDRISEGDRSLKRVSGIRLSTRPDYIDKGGLSLLKRYGVTTIELGAQSLDDEVLMLSGRGHSVRDVEQASGMILNSGFKLGLQMMTGLPGDSPEKSIKTARRIVELGAACTRIYPTLVIKGTDLENRWRNGEYKPQTLDEAVELSAKLLGIFRDGGVDVIRVGLHPSEGLLKGSEMLDGPFHPSFRELVETFIWKQKAELVIRNHPEGGTIRIQVPENELRYAIGYNSANRKLLENHFSSVGFSPEDSPKAGIPLIIADKRLPLPAKNALKKEGKFIDLATEGVVYKSISGHPDVFMCHGDEGLVVAPGIAGSLHDELLHTGIHVMTGGEDPAKTYPGSARYNAVITSGFIIHNLKLTDPVIFKAFPGRKHLHVNQGYTRCNLLPLGHEHFITSDRGIEKVLQNEHKRVLFAEPEFVRLRGQKYGFFPGCCGIYKNCVYIAGSLRLHPRETEIRDFIQEAGLIVCELYEGALADVGGIFFFDRD